MLESGPREGGEEEESNAGHNIEEGAKSGNYENNKTSKIGCCTYVILY